MRELNTAIDWQIFASGSPADSSITEAWTCSSADFEYCRISVGAKTDSHVLLYARSLQNDHQTYVLGAFDTLAQADLFTALHLENPLFVPALTAAFHWPIDPHSPPPYEGVYRVGMKSYRVKVLGSNLWRVEYLEGYKAQLLGEASSAIDACLLVYNHFDGRLRGCKLC